MASLKAFDKFLRESLRGRSMFCCLLSVIVSKKPRTAQIWHRLTIGCAIFGTPKKTLSQKWSRKLFDSQYQKNLGPSGFRESFWYWKISCTWVSYHDFLWNFFLSDSTMRLFGVFRVSKPACYKLYLHPLKWVTGKKIRKVINFIVIVKKLTDWIVSFAKVKVRNKNIPNIVRSVLLIQKQDSRLAKAYFSPNYKIFDQFLKKLKYEATVLGLVFKCFQNINSTTDFYFLCKRNAITFFRWKLFVSQCQKVWLGNPLVFQRVSVIEKLYG